METKIVEFRFPEKIENPHGKHECFDSTAVEAFQWMKKQDLRICHGLWKGRPGCHAWIETGGIAHDKNLGNRQRIPEFNQHFSYIVKYNLLHWIMCFTQTNYPGPWDEKIKAETLDAKRGSNDPTSNDG